MKILSAEEIRLWDQFTFRHEPIAPIDLMERAAGRCVDWIDEQLTDAGHFQVFCGKGNNGGDGLAIARLLSLHDRPVTVHILEFGHKGTEDFQTNLERLHAVPGISLHFIQSAEQFPALQPDDVVVDALFGSGLNRRLEGLTAELVAHINQHAGRTVSIDIPSGMFVDRTSRGNAIIQASDTLSFQCLKPAFLIPENCEYLGDVHVLDIGLHPGFPETITPAYEWVDANMAASIRKPRSLFSHKGNFGHALLVCGSLGKIGAAVLAARACLRSGVGLLYCQTPRCGYPILQTTVPEAMVLMDANDSIPTSLKVDTARFDAIGIGPGIGTAAETKMLLRELFDAYRHPIVIDADALNLLAGQKDLLALVPPGSILTPHPREFERLFGETANDFDRLELTLQKSKELNVIIVLKGHYSFIATPDRKGFFNASGNPGMATAGSGDVLTGILTGLLAQGYSSVETALLGVYLHGSAGDLAAEKESPEALIAGDIISQLGNAFRQLS